MEDGCEGPSFARLAEMLGVGDEESVVDVVAVEDEAVVVIVSDLVFVCEL